MPYIYENFDKHDNNAVTAIHSEDNMLTTWTYQDLMDIAIANCKKPITGTDLKRELQKQLDMVIEDMWEGYELCKENMLREINKE